jgi:aa3 type cytochrome c oxidase subunit IV
MTAADPDYQRHYRSWIGFTKFLKIGLTAVILILIGMALFLL